MLLLWVETDFKVGRFYKYVPNRYLRFNTPKEGDAGIVNHKRQEISFPYGGRVTFKAKSLDSKSNVDLKFKFEYKLNDYSRNIAWDEDNLDNKDVDYPKFSTDIVSVEPGDYKTYSIYIPSKESTDIFSSHSIYPITENVEFMIKDVNIISYEDSKQSSEVQYDTFYTG